MDLPAAHLRESRKESSPSTKTEKIGVDLVDSPARVDEFTANQDKHFADFCKELEKQTEIIVVDSTNIREEEYMHFIDEAQKRHYFTSIVTLPMNASIEAAAKRS